MPFLPGFCTSPPPHCSDLPWPVTGPLLVLLRRLSKMRLMNMEAGMAGVCLWLYLNCRTPTIEHESIHASVLLHYGHGNAPQQLRQVSPAPEQDHACFAGLCLADCSPDLCQLYFHLVCPSHLLQHLLATESVSAPEVQSLSSFARKHAMQDAVHWQTWILMAVGRHKKFTHWALQCDLPCVLAAHCRAA